MKYNLSDFVELNDNIKIPVFASSFSAGTGTPFDDGIVEIEVSKKFVKSSKHPHGLTVKGDSMEPTLIVGDFIIIDFGMKAKNGHIVAVNYNGELLIKEFRETHLGYQLVSHNDKYPTITINEFDQFHILGPVVNYKRSLI